MNRVKSQQKALVSLVSVLMALILAYGTIGTSAWDEVNTEAATYENDPAEAVTVETAVPEVQGENSETVSAPSVQSESIVDEPATTVADVTGGDASAAEEEVTEPELPEGETGEDTLLDEGTEEEPKDVPADVPEEVAKLLVTSKQYYDEETVANALSIPLESNDARYNFITGSDYKVYTMTDKPEWYPSEGVASKRMSTFDVPYWVMDKSGNRTATSGKITINEVLADSVKCIFSDIFLLEEQFPINYLVGFMYRKVGGAGLVNSPILSAHSFGVAIDINHGDYDNDLYVGKGNDLRDRSNPYCISDEVIEVFKSWGWNWGGEFDICSDTMHFQYFGLEFLQYESDEPFPVLEVGKTAKSNVVLNLRSRLVKLGYLKKATGKKYDKDLAEAVKKFQEDNGLEPDGIVDYETWVPIINFTHDMSYVF